VQADLAIYERVKELYRQIKTKNRAVHCAALNAGVDVGGEFTKIPLAKEIDMINLNVVSAVPLAKRLTQGMKENSHGRLLSSPHPSRE